MGAYLPLGDPKATGRLRARPRRCSARVAVLLIGLAISSCTCTRDVTPWFRVEMHRPLIDQPVQIGPRAHAVAWMRIAGKWVRVGEGRILATRAHGAVLFFGERAWKIARKTGELAPLEVQCTFPAIHPSKPIVYCAECTKVDASGDCHGSTVTELDLDGRVIRAYKGAEPSIPGGYGLTLVGLLEDGSVVLSTRGRCQLFAVGPGGSTRFDVQPDQPGCHWLRDWNTALSQVGAERLVSSEEGITW